ncbi:hypothetical protein ECO25NV_36830 [Escherichia coli O25:H4]|nr:hypothetical protein ECO25NV_36830 [Escherichia coli O25:H4]
MDLRDSYARQVKLLMAALPHVAKESCFALKGGTAINLFVQDFPRLSVDIDLAYKSFADRDTDLAAINDALKRITASLNGRPGITAIRQENKADEKRIIVNTADAKIKIEVSPVWRGLLLPPAEMPVCERVEMEYGFTTMSVVSLADLYGGKICAVKWSTKTGHRVRVFSSIDFPIRLVVTHHYIRAVLVRCNIQRYSPLLRELHR